MNKITQAFYSTKSKLTSLGLMVFFAMMLFPELATAQWTYDFGTGTGNPSGSFTSTTGSYTYLPTAPSGTARVRAGATGGAFALINPGLATLGATSEMQFTGNTGSTATSKFSIFDWTTATKVGYVKFKIAFVSGTNGVYRFSIGDGATFSDSSPITQAQTFAAIQWTETSASAISYAILNSAGNFVTTGLTNPTTTFTQTSTPVYTIEVYCNNESTSQNYDRSGSISLAASTWDLWVNGTKLGSNLAKSNLGANVTFDSFAFNTQSNVTTPGKIYIDDIEYSNALPAAVSNYTMDYDGNSQTTGSAPSDSSSPYASAATVTVLGNSGTLARTNYTFSDWNTQADGLGTDRAVASTFSIAANTTLYAKWTGSVAYNGNGNTGGSVPSTDTGVIAGANYTVAANSGTLVQTGFTFGGWNTQADGSGTNYTAGSGSFAFAGNTTLYAKWNGAASTVATLASMTLSTGAISPTFASGTTAYTQTVANAVSGVTVTPTVTEPNATIRVRTNANSFATLASGSTSGTLGLTVGVNTLDVEVTAQDGTTIITYTTTITRSLSADSSLLSLSTTAGTLSPTFAGGTFSYNIVAAVPFATAVTVTASRNQANATMQVQVNGGGYSTLPNATATAVALAVGANTIDVLVTAQNSTTSTYSITVTRSAPSNVATLSALTTTAGTLTPAFVTGTKTYTASVVGTTGSVTVTPTRTQANATIQARVNGGSYVSVTSGSPSSALALNVGVNPIEVLVTAQDGTTTDLYTINVTRASAPLWNNPITGTSPGNTSPYTTGDSSLSGITVSGISRSLALSGATRNDSYNTTNWNDATFTSTKYLEFTITPDITKEVNFTNFTFTTQTTGTIGSAQGSIRSSVDNFASDLATVTLNATNQVISLAGANFQAVQSPITFRLYCWGGTGTVNFAVNDFEFNGAIATSVARPEINVKQVSSITSGGTYGFGNQENGTNSGPITFTIENLGNAVLNLTGSPKVAITGTDASEFTINQVATTATVAATTGTTTFTVTFTPGSTGAKTAQLSIANDDSNENPYLINLTGTSTTSQLSSISAATFTPSTNIAYGSFTSNNITSANSLEVGQFTLQDGASDNDSFGTTINTITFSLTNSANVQKVALYDGATELQEIAAGATNVFNAGLGALTTIDGGTKTFSIRVTFNTSVTDNQNFQFAVTNVTADGAGSGFAVANGGGATTSIAGNDNRIVVTATKLKFGTVLGSSITVPLPSFTVYAVDANDNTDLDGAASVTLTTDGTNATFTNPYALTGGSINISNVVYGGAVQQTGIKLTAAATGLSPNADSNTFDILTVTYPANSYRTTSTGTWPGTSTATWERFVSNIWGSASAPNANTTDVLYIRNGHTITQNTAFAGTSLGTSIIVENGGSFIQNNTCTIGSLKVENNGTFTFTDSRGSVKTSATANVVVESGGNFVVNSGINLINGQSNIWDGTEDFQDGSNLTLQGWDYAGTAADRFLIQNPTTISANTTSGYYFGNLTISGAPGSLFTIVEGSQTINLCKNNLTISETGTNNVALTNSGTNATIGGNLIVTTGQLSIAGTTIGDPVTTVLGNISVANGATFNLNQNSSATATSTIQLKGNLSVVSGGTINSTDAGCQVVFSGTAGTQTASIAGSLGTNANFEVGDGTNASTLQLINQDFSLTNASNSFFVRANGTLDFNYRNIVGAGIFALDANGTLKITSNLGVNAFGNNTGNLQNTPGSRTISQSGIFHYIGNVTPQATGTAISTGSTAKVIIIEKTNPTDVVNLTQSTGSTARLEIREGTFVETIAANISGSGELRMSGGTYKTAVTSGAVPLLSGAFNLTAGTVELNAGAAQALKGAKDYANLTINLSSGTATMMNGDVTVNKVLNLTNGILVTTAPYKVISTATGSVTRTNGWVNGNLQRYVGTTTTAIPFDIGDATNYTPVALQFASPTGTGSVIVKQTNGIIPSSATSAISSTKVVNRYYTLTNSGVGSLNYAATFNFVAGDVLGGADPNNFVVGKYDGTTWTYPTVGTKTATSTQATGLTSISPSDFYIGECATLVAYNVTGGGAYCAGGSGVAVGLSNSQTGMNYQLKLDGNDVGSSVTGTGAAITFGNQTAAGVYTIVGTNACNDTATMTGSVTITVSPAIGFANLQSPASGTICQAGTFDAFGQVYIAGVTDPAGQAPGITVEFGYDTANSNPSTWTNWSGATFNAQALNNDEYKYTFTPPTSGTFYYTFRYKSGACDWVYGGYNGGFWNGTTNVNGQLDVNSNAAHTITLSSGSGTNTQALCQNTAIPTAITYTIAGGATGAGVTGLPSGMSGTYNAGTFTISGTPNVSGTFNYTITTSGNGCASSTTATGTLTVSNALDYANLQFPGTATICQGGGSLTAYGQVYEPGVTPGYNNQGAGITVEFGYNTSNTDPTSWTNWTTATFNGTGGGNDNDEYQYTFTPPTSGTFYYTFRYQYGSCVQYGGYNSGGGGFWNGTTNVSGVLTVNPNTWNGSNGLWSVATNWSCGVVPNGATDVVIPSGTPTLNVDYTANSGTTLTINGSGSLIVNPIITLTIAGTAAFNGQPITFESDATGTGMLGQVTGTVTGASNVTVKRFIPSGKRAFRFLTPGVTTTSSISLNWQQATHITGSTTGANGFDITVTGNPSMYTYNNQVASGTGWTAIPNTNATTLLAGTGYRMLIRGDRTPALITTASQQNMNAAITLSATGTLVTGTVTVNASSTPAINNTTNATTNGFSLVGNPYISPIDWNAVGKSGLKDAYYGFEPNFGTGLVRGKYVAYDASTGLNNESSSNIGRYIQSGQAFMVKNTAVDGTPGTLTFNESNKASTQASVFKSANTQNLTTTNAVLRLSVYDPNELALASYPIDGTVAVFGTDFTNDYGYGDVVKLLSTGENLGLFKESKTLAIEALAPVQNNDELLVKTTQFQANKSYTFKVSAEGFSADVTAYLVDQYLNTQSAINMEAQTFATFTTSTDVNSYGADRFKIVFSNTALGNDSFARNAMVVYPNPVTDNTFNISVPSNVTGAIQVTVYNLVGQEMYRTTEQAQQTVTIRPNRVLAQGVYIVQITNDGKTTNSKITIQ